MRIDPQQWQEWQSRLEQLQQLQRSQPQWAWFWDVRIQVLKYFCSRYGRLLSPAERLAAEAPATAEDLPKFSHRLPQGPFPRVRSTGQLRAAITDLHEARCAAESGIAARRELD